jgi:hypothetical protein
LKNELTFCRDKLTSLEDNLKKNNLIIEGLSEDGPESPIQLNNKIFDLLSRMKIQNARNLKFEKLYRIGPVTSRKPRPIMIQFAFNSDRNAVWQAKKHLRGSTVFLKEDVSKETARYRSKLVPILKAARAANKKCTINGDTLVLEGKKYPKGTLDTLPEPLSLEKLTMKRNADSIAFHGRACPLSNFFDSKFTIADVLYDTVEQYYQAQKAKHHDEMEIHDKIMLSRDPTEQKKLGSSVKTSPDAWDKQAPEIMHLGLLAKFTQNDNLKDFLLDTDNKKLYEASPKDLFWGIGMGLSNTDIFNQEKHQGRNIMDELLMSVREQLKSPIDSNTSFLNFIPPNHSTSPISMDCGHAQSQ